MIPSVLLLLEAARASCMAPPPLTRVRTRRLGPKTPILLETTFNHGERLAKRIRLRGPDGELVATRVEVHGLDARILPRGRWRPGRHVVEERGDYDTEGRRIFNRQPAAHAAWFPITELEATADTPPTLRPTQTSWHRLGDPTRRSPSEIYALVPKTPGVDWVELEIQGVGVIRRTTHPFEGQFRLWSGADVICNDTHQLQPVPPTGDLTVRVRYHGENGAEGVGPWQVLGEATQGSSFRKTPPLPPPGPQSGRPADIRRLSSWRRLKVQPDKGPSAIVATECGGLALAEVTVRPVPSGTRLEHDAALQIHTVAPHDDGLLFDGVLVPDLDATHVRRVRGADPIVLAQTDDTAVALVALEDGKILGRATFPDVQFAGLVEEAGQIDLVVRHPDNTRIRHHLSEALLPTAEPERVWQPVDVRARKDGAHINGVPLPDGPHYAYPRTAADLVLLEVRGSQPGLALFTDRGELLWTLPKPPDLRQVHLDEHGVVAVVGPHRDTTIWARDRAGQVRTDATFPEPSARSERPLRRVAWRGGSLVVHGTGVSFEETPGRFTPPLAADSFLGLDGEDFVFQKIEGNEMTRRALTCGGDPVGVPIRWTPPGE